MTIALVLLLGLVASLLATAVARQRFQSRVSAEVATLLSGGTAYLGADQLVVRQSSLPEPVRRYLAFAVSEQARPFVRCGFS